MRILLSEIKQNQIKKDEFRLNMLHSVIKIMLDEGIDLKGWKLDEQPTDNIFCFYNPDRNKSFDILVAEKDRFIPYYVGESDEQDINSFPVSTIKEAIEKYIVE
ncbi:hypothetical protein [Enterococcus mundtii]|uniref:Uncharacterized protein n=1 Tax=Enterococcus mundtii TaxID=53346 RepID=A0A1V2UJG9_ENTMU|nr:hypothetical protein [Enterococcus mundtii]ONN43533.1 hypothetical protein BTN92_06795 [Enterococcus mundtii]